MLGLLSVCCFQQTAYAGDTLLVLGDDVMVYAGPGERFRPLAVLDSKSEVPVGSSTVQGRDGIYYRVLVTLPNEQKARGYISVEAPVRRSSQASADDVDHYPELALKKKGFHVQGYVFKSEHQLYTFGESFFLTPGFFVKGFAGLWRAPLGNAGTVGAEFGNDSLLYKNISSFLTVGFAGLFASEENRVFVAGKKVNALALASIGLRYNRPDWSVGLAFSQAAAFNNNNSLVVFGGLISLDLPL